MSILDTILAHKRDEVRERKRQISRRELQEKEFFSFRRLSLARALKRCNPAIVAEVKKASPSKGIIRKNFDPLAIARSYVQHGAASLSVLTDEKFFQGELQFIERMRSFVPVPILRKDFIIDAYQLYEAKSSGADAVLLIAAALDSSQLQELHDEATEIDLECLVEVHSTKEVDSLDLKKVNVVGINNRDLATFETDLETSVAVKAGIPDTAQVVSESGIDNADDVHRLMRVGINAFLIGESFMRVENPGEALRGLLTSVGQSGVSYKNVSV